MQNKFISIQVDRLLGERGQKDPLECLDHLMGFRDFPESNGFPISFWLHMELVTMKATNGIWPYNSNMPLPKSAEIIRQFGIRAGKDHFAVANNHPNLDLVYDDTIWQGGLWKYALLAIPGATRDFPRRFPGAGSQLSTKLPVILFKRYTE